MDIEKMRAQVADHDAKVQVECRAAIAELVATEAYGEVRAKLTAIAGKAPRAPIDVTLASIGTSLDLLEQLGR